MRTTLNIDDPVLKELKRLQGKEGKSLGRLVSDLLAQALGQRRAGQKVQTSFRWISRPMGARVDLADRDALLAAMDGEPP
jgi:hypothetical protein